MGVVVALTLSLGGEPGLPLERVLPDHVAARVRMLSLQRGMSEAAVDRRMGLKDRFVLSGGGTIWAHWTTYAVGRTHELTLWYEMADDGRSYRLSKATLDPRPDK